MSGSVGCREHHGHPLAHYKALPFESLRRNAEAITAMEEARAGNFEIVTLAYLYAILDTDN